jgi:hypothetical protein
MVDLGRHGVELLQLRRTKLEVGVLVHGAVCFRQVEQHRRLILYLHLLVAGIAWESEEGEGW